MSSHVFHEIYLHLIWHTKNNHPLLTTKLEPFVHQLIRDRCRSTTGVTFHGVGGVADHVHLVINIDPAVCISDLVGELKGSCSREINQTERYKALEWQRGFGVVSFGKKQLEWVLQYYSGLKTAH